MNFLTISNLSPIHSHEHFIQTEHGRVLLNFIAFCTWSHFSYTETLGWLQTMLIANLLKPTTHSCPSASMGWLVPGPPARGDTKIHRCSSLSYKMAQYFHTTCTYSHIYFNLWYLIQYQHCVNRCLCVASSGSAFWKFLEFFLNISSWWLVESTDVKPMDIENWLYIKNLKNNKPNITANTRKTKWI